MSGTTIPETEQKGEEQKPQKDRPQDPGLSPMESLRWLWTQLTSMRTALVLLFLVALAAIPGSLIPQRSVTPIRVQDFQRDHPTLNKLYEPLGMYDVYSSPWFSAIYLLLFLSLLGCIIPRIRVYLRAVKTPPPRIPSRLTRLPESRTGQLRPGLAATEALGKATEVLKRKRFRVAASEGSAKQGDWRGLSAERGYLREFGNLLFHLSLVGVLIGVAWNNLYSYKGTAMVVEGRGFSNVITQYDEFRAGPMVNTDELPPFSLKLKRFFAEFEKGPVQRGAARLFRAEVTATSKDKTEDTAIEVNHPLTIGQDKVHVIGHGYAAHVTIKDGKGNLAFQGPVIFLPQDGNLTSMGVIKAPDARPKQLAFEGLFLPTAVVDQRGPRSTFPDAANPELFLNVWSGPPRQETGRPENVYVLNKAGLSQVTNESGGPVAIRLKPGTGYKLPDGQGSISFDGWSRWAKLQISHAPGLPVAFTSLALGTLGLCLSLFIRPRRLWVRVREDGQVEVAGLDRADSRSGLPEDVEELLATLAGESPDQRPEPPDPEPVATEGEKR